MAIKTYFDNVIRSKPSIFHKFLLFHDFYKLVTNGDVYFAALHETCYATLFTLVLYDDNFCYVCETNCTYDEYSHLLDTIPTLYHYKDFFAFLA